jgi:ribosomal protein S18 acetylase RimI-like enzyme
MEIRTAIDADIDEVVDLWERHGGPTSLPGGAGEASALLRRDPDALVIARIDGALAGSIIAGWDGWRCHLYRLVVDPRWRRRGVATQLVATAAKRARDVGARKIDATVNFENGAAISFWERQQFERDPRDGRWSLRLGPYPDRV